MKTAAIHDFLYWAAATSKVHFMPARLTLISFSAVQEVHGVLNLLDVVVKLRHTLVVAVDCHGQIADGR